MTPSTAHFRPDADLADPAALRPAGPVAGQGSRESLLVTLGDARAPLADRLAAGAMLGLTGDPRIGDTPLLCAVPGDEVDIGLAADDLPGVTATWRHVGVEESWIAKEVPRHRVRLDSYWIAAYPVTNAEYAVFLTETGRQHRPLTWYLGAYPWDRANHPVAGVEAADADAYAAWLSRRTGHPWRLPSEAEWEYAAAGPDGLDYPWGDDFDPGRANTRETGIHTTSPVGCFPSGRSPFGVYDMAGNVEEYVTDRYGPYPGGAAVHDDLWRSVGDYRVTRGGSFARFGDLARTRRRHGAFPSVLYPVGFRLATSRQPEGWS